MMKINKRMVSLLVLGLACLMVTPGCRKNKSGVNDLVTGGLVPMDGGDTLEGYPMGMRFDGSTMKPHPVTFDPVYFEYDSARLNSGERAKADLVADEMRGTLDAQLVVEGHCDERGDREYNLALGERRALAVRAYIIELGIDSGRITTKSYGEENPTEFGHDEASYQLNRRGEMLLFTP